MEDFAVYKSSFLPYFNYSIKEKRTNSKILETEKIKLEHLPLLRSFQ
jgi:hypothetical protein